MTEADRVATLRAKAETLAWSLTTIAAGRWPGDPRLALDRLSAMAWGLVLDLAVL